jgi:hypothetical protein
MTAFIVVTRKGRIIGERYGVGVTRRTPLEALSMGNTLNRHAEGSFVGQSV